MFLYFKITGGRGDSHCSLHTQHARNYISKPTLLHVRAVAFGKEHYFLCWFVWRSDQTENAGKCLGQREAPAQSVENDCANKHENYHCRDETMDSFSLLEPKNFPKKTAPSHPKQNTHEGDST